MIEQANHPAVQLIFDTGHVHDAGSNVLACLEAAFPHSCLIQFADQPGRVEPGAGEIDFRGIVRFLKAHSYSGLVELEHGWSSESVSGENEGLKRLRELDAE